MTGYTYDRQFWAHFGDDFAIVPDQVASDQAGYAARNEVFLAIHDGGFIAVQVDAEATGLATAGTGDLVVRLPLRPASR